MNEAIRGLSEVRLLQADGTAVGIVPFADALAEAKQQGLDLVEVAPQASPPVCKIQDYKRVRRLEAGACMPCQRKNEVASPLVVVVVCVCGRGRGRGAY